MGYWVSVSGNMELRNITDGDARRIIESVIDPHMYDTAIDIEANDSGDVLIDLWAYIKWHDGIDDMLADLSPYTVEGEIECTMSAFCSPSSWCFSTLPLFFLSRCSSISFTLLSTKRSRTRLSPLLIRTIPRRAASIMLLRAIRPILRRADSITLPRAVSTILPRAVSIIPRRADSTILRRVIRLILRRAIRTIPSRAVRFPLSSN